MDTSKYEIIVPDYETKEPDNTQLGVSKKEIFIKGIRSSTGRFSVKKFQSFSSNNDRPYLDQEKTTEILAFAKCRTA